MGRRKEEWRMNRVDIHEDEEVGPDERRVRSLAVSMLRLLLASLMAAAVSDLFFNTIWLHSYVWALNYDYADEKLNRAADNHMQSVHTQLYPDEWRFWHHIAVALFVRFICLPLVLMRGGQRRLSSWRLWFWAQLTALSAALFRWTQQRQRLLGAIHEAFFFYLCLYIVALPFIAFLPVPVPVPVLPTTDEEEEEEKEKKSC